MLRASSSSISCAQSQHDDARGEVCVAVASGRGSGRRPLGSPSSWAPFGTARSPTAPRAKYLHGNPYMREHESSRRGLWRAAPPVASNHCARQPSPLPLGRYLTLSGGGDHAGASSMRCTLTETAGVCHRTPRVFDRRAWLATAVLAAGVVCLPPSGAPAGGKGPCATAAAGHP